MNCMMMTALSEVAVQSRPAVDVIMPAEQTLPAVFASPHSRHRLSARVRRAIAPAVSGPAAVGGQLRRRTVRQRAGLRGAAGAGALPARLRRSKSRAVRAGSRDVRGRAAGLRQHRFAARGGRARHDRQGGRQRRGDLCPPAALHRGQAAHRYLLSALPRRAAPGADRDPHALRLLPVDRLPFHAVGRRSDGARCRAGARRFRARRLPRHLLRQGGHRAGRAGAARPRLCGGAQHALFRRLRDAALRAARRRPACAADRDQPRALHG